jgi:TolA-binding protein
MTPVARGMGRIGATAALALSFACVTGRGAPERPVASRDWGQTLAQAEVLAGDHRYAEADKLLADYSSLYPGTEGAVESAYWRGLLALDPNNHDGSAQVAAALFQTYANAGGALPHRREAEILQRVAVRIQSPTTTTVAVGTTTTPQSTSSPDRSADLKAKDAEIQRLKDELAKANDELERIKKRLTTPTKP